MDLKQEFESRGLAAQYDAIMQRYAERVAQVRDQYARRSIDDSKNDFLHYLDVCIYLSDMGSVESAKWEHLHTLLVLGDGE